MLPLAIVEWRRNQVTFQASDETWNALIERLRFFLSPPNTALVEKIKLDTPTDGKQRRLTFSSKDGQVLWDLAKL